MIDLIVRAARACEGEHKHRLAYAVSRQLAQTTLRSVLGQHELDDMLSERDKLIKR